MIDLNQYLLAPYLDGGRTLQGLDCWGLLLLVREDLGCRPLPSIGAITRREPAGMQHCYARTLSVVEECNPEAGAVAAVFRGKALVHVGVVLEIDGRLAVLETNPKTGARWLRVRPFESQYAKVIYYRDRNLSEQA